MTRFYSLLALFLGGALFLDAKPLNVKVSAPSAIVINADTGQVLYEKNAHAPAYPASITKIATALYALERKGEALDVKVVAPSEALSTVSSQARRANYAKYPAYRLETGGSHMGLKTGEELSLRDLLYGMMVVSGNDAANVIATHVSGGVSEFVEELNGFLKAKGVNETHFCNPHGLHYPDHRTTAYDMAKMAQLALQSQEFRNIVKTVHYIRPKTNKQEEVPLAQTNRLLKRGAFYYPKAIGIKTGYTSHAGYTLVGAAQDKGRTLIVVLLNCSELNQRYRDAMTLFEAAFSEQPVTRMLFTKQHDLYSVAVKGGKVPLQAAPVQDITFTYYPAEEPEFTAFLHWDELEMPILKDQVVGEIRLYAKTGELLQSSPLSATGDVPATFWFQCMAVGADAKEILFNRITLILLLMATVSVGAWALVRKTAK